MSNRAETTKREHGTGWARGRSPWVPVSWGKEASSASPWSSLVSLQPCRRASCPFTREPELGWVCFCVSQVLLLSVVFVLDRKGQRMEGDTIGYQGPSGYQIPFAF